MRSELGWRAWVLAVGMVFAGVGAVAQDKPAAEEPASTPAAAHQADPQFLGSEVASQETGLHPQA